MPAHRTGGLWEVGERRSWPAREVGSEPGGQSSTLLSLSVTTRPGSICSGHSGGLAGLGFITKLGLGLGLK